MLTAFKLRGMLGDFIDCLILSSAVNQCDAFITEDSNIQNLNRNKDELLNTINPEFKIQALAETV